MGKFLFTLVLLCSQAGYSQIIRCRGDIGFWVQTKKKAWEKIDPQKQGAFEAFVPQIGYLKVGKTLRFPAAEIYPLGGITYKIKNKDLKVETDKETYFTVNYKKNVLQCDIHFGTGF